MRRFAPSYVVARCDHVLSASAAEPVRRLSAGVATSASGLVPFEFAYRPQTRSPVRSFSATVRQELPRALGFIKSHMNDRAAAAAPAPAAAR